MDFATDIVLGDFNGDGRLDMFFPGLGEDFDPPGEMNRLLLSQPDGTYRDASVFLPAVTDYSNTAAVGDVNGDGYLDIYVANVGYDSNSTAPYFLLGTGNGSFTRIAWNLPDSGVSLLFRYPASALVDVDNDGYLDLVLGSNGGAPSLTLLNDGHGDFTKRPPIELPPGLFDTGESRNTNNRSIVSIDLNGDGLPDLVLSQTQNSASGRFIGHGIQALINDGRGGFIDQTSTYIVGAVDPAHSWITTLRVADLNGDGIPDFYGQGIFNRDHSDPQTDPPTIAWVSDGLGHWIPLTTHDVDPQLQDAGQFVVMTDIDGDGLPDLVFMTSLADTDPIAYEVYFNVTAKPTWSVNYEGMWWAAPAGSESGWGLYLSHQGDVVFAAWFTYDVTGEAWWLSMTANKTPDGGYAGTIYRTNGPPFDAVRFDPSSVTRTAVGSGALKFIDANRGSLESIVNGIKQTKALTRTVFGSRPNCTYSTSPNFAGATNYQGLWWAAAESGWGIGLTHQGDTIFAAWFTYDIDGTPLWFSATALKAGAGIYGGQLYRSTGPPFNARPFDPALVKLTEAGTATFTFGSGNAATFDSTVNGVSQSKQITRTLFAPPAGTICH